MQIWQRRQIDHLIDAKLFPQRGDDIVAAPARPERRPRLGGQTDGQTVEHGARVKHGRLQVSHLVLESGTRVEFK